MNPKTEVAGKITLKHVYEIAQVKAKDSDYECVPLQKVCDDVIRAARSLGIKVVHRLDDRDYEQFLKERDEVVQQQLTELEEKKQSKMLRS
jgi:large subunit ribosomal protein L11